MATQPGKTAGYAVLDWVITQSLSQTPMRRWSKLQSALYRVITPGVRLQLQCRVVRMNSAHGSSDLPRYWITLGKETIWAYPDQFAVPGGGTKRTDSSKLVYYPHVTDVPAISDLIREYIDTPVADLLTRRFENDHWGLVNILRAADRRIGMRQLPTLRKRLHNIAALKVLDARLARHAPRPGAGSSGAQGNSLGAGESTDAPQETSAK
jgi:hypothetical protein